jgi:hypothetical protein
MEAKVDEIADGVYRISSLASRVAAAMRTRGFG